MILVYAMLLTPQSALQIREAFPAYYTARTQATRCRDHADHLRGMRSRCGHEDGRWDLWIAETEEYEAAWNALAAAEWDLNEATMRKRLEEYHRLVGDYRYLKRWSPPRFPAPGEPAERIDQ